MLPIVDTHTINNFLTEEEVQVILDEYKVAVEAYGNAPFYRDGILQNYTNGIIYPVNNVSKYVPEYRKSIVILESKIKKHFGPDIVIGTCHILQSFQPYKCHTDAEYGQAGVNDKHYGAYTFVIPLETVDSYTIVFNETFDKGKLIDEWLQENPNRPKKNTITDEIYNKHLSAEYREYMRYLSIDTIFPWTKGACLAMSRYKFHGSDNFPLKIPSKLGIICWTVFRYGPKS